MKFIPGLLILLLFLSDCQKSDDEKEDSLKQYFQCVIDDRYNLSVTENELTNIYPSSFLSYPTDPNKITYYINSQIEILNTGGAVDNIGISFFTTPRPDEYVLDKNSVPIYKYNKFESFFQPGNIPFLEQQCRGLSVQPQVALSFYYGTSNIHWYPQTYDVNCNVNNSPIHNEGNFTITKSENYFHKKHGRCILITGTFELTVFTVSNGSQTQVLKIRDGRFKLLVKDWAAKPIFL